MARQFLEKKLKAPATAKHPWCGDAQIIETAPGQFTVTSHVDAQNSFGALIRTHYTAKLSFGRYDEKGAAWWNLVDLSTTP
jgi:hypothetical protein